MIDTQRGVARMIRDSVVAVDRVINVSVVDVNPRPLEFSAKIQPIASLIFARAGKQEKAAISRRETVLRFFFFFVSFFFMFLFKQRN